MKENFAKSLWCECIDWAVTDGFTLARHPQYCIATESFGCSLSILAQFPSL